MDNQMIIRMLITTVGGLGIFLLGMKQMSDGVQALASEKLRILISKVTDNRFLGTGIGILVTSIIQSSSVTTVMVVGLVNAGVMTLPQSIGIILGADIGTTVTAWIISLKIADYGLPLLGVTAFVFLFSRSERVRFTSMFVLGLAMIFYGLEIMRSGFAPLHDNQDFIMLLAKFHPSNISGLLKCILIGAFVTAIVQSSSATVAITITLAQTAFIDYQTAVALVLGNNIGTTITAYLASIGASRAAFRAALAHILIKIMAVIILIPLFYLYIDLLAMILPADMKIGNQIALAHTLFNIFLVAIFIGFIKPLTSLLFSLVPEKDDKNHGLFSLDPRWFEAPAVAVTQSFEAVKRMMDSVQKMNEWLVDLPTSIANDIENKLQQQEQFLDVLQKDLVEYISTLLSHNLSDDDRQELRKQLRLADEFESMSDHLVLVYKIHNKIVKNGLKYIEQDRENLTNLHSNIMRYVEKINLSVKKNDATILEYAEKEGKEINQNIKKCRTAHLNRLGSKHYSPLLSLYYADILSTYRRIKEHALTVAEIMVSG